MDWDAELEYHHKMHMIFEEKDRLKNCTTYYTTDNPHVLTIAMHDGVLTVSDIIKNIMRMIMMNQADDECSGYSAKDAIEEIQELSWADFSKLKKEAMSYLYDADWQIYLERKHITDGAELKPITEEEAFDIMDEFSLNGFELWELKDVEWDYTFELSASDEIVSKMIEMCGLIIHNRC